MSGIRSISTLRLGLAAVLSAVASLGASPAARSASAATHCVGATPGCFSTIQAAVDAAQSGETIQVGPGTFAGGVRIAKSLNLVGVSASATIVKGGGPVVTIGDPTGATTPTVSVSRVTITGGVTHSTAAGGTAIAMGGGIAIPGPAGGFATGAIVTISESIITGNRVSPLTVIEPTLPPRPPCGSRRCAFALGGGIDNQGTLTLTNTQVIDNAAGSTPTDASVATDASGGGIYSHPGATLTLKNSVVTGNTSAVGLPDGQFTDGGGITSGGLLHVQGSSVSGNSSTADAAVSSSFFSGDTQQEANAGGIRLLDGSSATIIGSSISDNRVSGTNTVGDANAEAGGIDCDGSLVMNDTTVDGNTVRATAPSGQLALAIDGGLQVQGSLVANGSRISGNATFATSVGGFAAAIGGGLDNLTQTTLVHAVVSGNSVTADGAFGLARGGGVVNFTVDPNSPPSLKVVNGSITGNSVQASPGVTREGGGLWTDTDVQLVRTVIEGNTPDQCVGC